MTPTKVIDTAAVIAAVIFVALCAAAPFLALFWSHDWCIGPHEGDSTAARIVACSVTVACIVAGHLTGVGGLWAVGWIIRLSDNSQNSPQHPLPTVRR